MTVPDLHEDFQDLAARLPGLPATSVDSVQRRAIGRQRRRRSLLLAATVVALVGGVVAASMWWPSGPLDPVIEPGPGSDGELGLAPGEDYSVLGALAEVPVEVVSDSPLALVTANVEGLGQRADVTLPVALDDETAIQRWQQLLGGTEQPSRPTMPLAPNWQRILLHDGLYEELGWSWLDVTAFVDVTEVSRFGQDQPAPIRYSVVTTGRDISFPETATRLDGDVVQIGTTDTDLADSSAARQHGQPLFMQTIERHVVAAGREQDTRAWRASSRPTLADDPALAAVAAVLDDAAALAADLGRADYTPPEELAAYDSVGIGESMVDGRPALTIAHHFPEADAAEQVERLRALWEAVEPLGQSSQMMLEITDSGSHGEVAWLTARPGNPAAIELIKILLVAGEGPFTS